MADRPPDDLEDLDDIEEGPADEGRVLAPDELDITESEHVEELEEGRFVVSPDGPPNVGPGHREEQTASESRSRQSDSPRRDDDPEEFTQQSQTRRTERSEQSRSASSGGTRERRSRDRQERTQRTKQPDGITQERVHQWLRQSFEDGHTQYGFDVTATFEGSVSQRRMASNDVVTIFESLMLWYAQQVDSDTPVEEILGILLTEANVPIRYPPESIHQLVKSSNLTPEDSIGDLLEEIDDGVQF
ncbi:hypothetical protein SAMN05216226_10115 [Halovenus aranensis]|jgi:hypothetical protein|uniref:Flagella cluster protein n=1 Tax=Halovenus aranensis TaxID=890420 RepID=A0A1G8RN55_9EURY|nr:hypothetical protein [Halovenus aranensis]SDJ18323.1 hypothetical protein SAMN05216226_10115 [Halovenus aranensis]